MGQEIVYCFKCQKRILGTEYAKGQAYLVENQACCSACAFKVLETLPQKARDELLIKMQKSTQERQSKTSGALKAMPSTPSRSSTGRIPILASPPGDIRPRVAGRPQAPTMLVVGIALGVLGLVLLIVLLSGGTSTPPPRPPESNQKPSQSRSPLPPGDPGPSPQEKRRAENAKRAVAKARDFEQARPKDFEGQAREWRAAIAEAESTGYEAEVRRELEKTVARAKDAAAQELMEFERLVRAPLGRREFKSALGLVDQARTKHPSSDWTAVLDRLDHEIRDTAARLFGELKEKAIAARDQGAKAQVEAAKADLVKWGFEEYVLELNSALALAWRPIFDGKTTTFLGNLSAPYWKVVDGALMKSTEADQSGQSGVDYGDGEFRFRFTMQGGTQVYFAVRQGNGWCRVVFSRPQIQSMGPGEHELIFTCKGSQVSAALDGNPTPVEQNTVLKLGRIQFNVKDGAFRLLALDYRDLP